jgi:beta-glucosidase/6-phospho-beta-glucosidase/beta-galactosidase
LGFEPKFGLIKVDRRDFRRTVKPSAKLMSKIAENSKNS